MRIEELDYHLPPELIAQHPPEKRGRSRLLVVNRAEQSIAHQQFADLPKVLQHGDCLVLNDTRVRACRLYLTRRSTGGRVEVFILEAIGDGRFTAMTRSGGSLKSAEQLEDDDHGLVVTLEERREGGVWLLSAQIDRNPASFEALETFGRMPLPPYIRRDKQSDSFAAEDRERYQTIYAAEAGAVAAPTAGLHFTPELLAELRAAGIAQANLTLHVGIGTFRPVTTAVVEDHPMHSEHYHLSDATASALAKTRAEGGRIVAVGSTSTRTLESCVNSAGVIEAGTGATDLMILPGYRFRAVDLMLTNFHLPKSTLMALVMAFATPELIREAYRQAVAERYRFFSYGDAMVII